MIEMVAGLGAVLYVPAQSACLVETVRNTKHTISATNS